jgi:DNA polymerase-3 subunit epsilon
MENNSTDSRQSWPRPQPFPRRAANGLLTYPQGSAAVAQDFHNAFSRTLSSLAEDCEEVAKRLEATGDYKVLRRLVPTEPTLPAIFGDKIGIIVDFETTGLDPETDEIIEVAMLKFRYSDRDEITGVSGTFQSFNQPAIAIPPDVVELTGISEEMVKGCRIDAAALEAFVRDANIVIAHNASFDRKFAERSWDIFRRRHWACSSSGIDWGKFGFSGTKLVYLLSQCGLFHGAHRALDDCHATLQILARPLPSVKETALAVLLENARCKKFRIWAEGAPFDLKDILRRRGYRWNNGAGGRPRSWYVDLEETALTTELDFLRNEIYGHDLNLGCTEITSLDRYSGRV